MGLLDVLRSIPTIAHSVLGEVECVVTYRKAGTLDEKGAPVAQGSPVSLKAIVDWRKQQVRTAQGVMSVVRPTILFLDIPALLAATGPEGLNVNDSLTLPDGTTGPINMVSSFLDTGTGRPLVPEVFLG